MFNVDALLFILYFFTPGIIALWVHDQIIPSDKRNWSEMAFGLLSYGGLNLLLYTLLAPAIQHLFPVLAVPTIISNRVIDGTSLIFLDLVLPVIVGFLSGLLQRSRSLQKRLHGLFLRSDPTPWDYVFSERKKCYGMLFHLKSGSKVAGIYGNDSYVSTFPSPKEIYLEKVCTIGEQGELLGVIPQTAGALISMDECSLVELFHIPIVVERNSLWQKIKKRLVTLIALFMKWLHNSLLVRWSHLGKKQLNKKDEVPLSKQISATSFPLGKAESSPLIQPFQKTDKQAPPTFLQLSQTQAEDNHRA